MRKAWLAAAPLLMALVAACGGGGGVTVTLHPTPAPPKSTPPALGSLSASGAGNRFYEIYDPVGSYRGTILFIHGGSWQDSRGGVDSPRVYAGIGLTLAAEGWRVVNIGYTPGYRPGAAPNPIPMLRDVVAYYDQTRAAFGGPVCAYGQSAGGHLTGMLAVERPSLTCAVLDAGPTDLPSLLRESTAQAQASIKGTFGTDPSTLAHWSPARDWTSTIRTRVYATFAQTDLTVPPRQGDVLKSADPNANLDVLPAGTQPWLHSTVDYNSVLSRETTGLIGWLKGIMKPLGAAAPGGSDVGSDCDAAPPSGQRYRLMLAGDGWQQQSSWRTGQPAVIAATRGCSGAAYYQDDGLSLWAWSSSPAAPLAAGQQASLTLSPGHAISRLTVSFRGFLSRPQDWDLGLYASTSSSGPVSTPVATCVRGGCSGLGLFRTSSGSLLTKSAATSDPDRSAQPPSATFTLPSGTARVAWRLECVAPGGCPVQSLTHPRARDPLGQQAIFSIYSAKAS